MSEKFSLLHGFIDNRYFDSDYILHEQHVLYQFLIHLVIDSIKLLEHPPSLSLSSLTCPPSLYMIEQTTGTEPKSHLWPLQSSLHSR
jgi:hypothetical protein